MFGMSLAARIQEFFQERRRDERERVLIPAGLRTEKGVTRAVLLNLSRAGAMMASVSPPEVDETVRLLCEDLEAAGKIAWTKGYQFGVAFHHKIDARQVAAIVAVAGGKGAGR
jgi:hypothetical protein